ncbi:MAG TPA: hypothetical protein VI036_19020 [Propionibacteriaceae bacterium]
MSWVVALHKHGRWGEIVNAVGCGNEEGREMITASMPNIFTREIITWPLVATRLKRNLPVEPFLLSFEIRVTGPQRRDLRLRRTRASLQL